MNKTETINKYKTYKVHNVRYLSDKTFLLRFDRDNISFKPGQYLNVGLEGSLHSSEFSIYSGDNKDFIELLIKENSEGNVTRELKYLNAGDNVVVKGPYGSMVLNEEDLLKHFVFIASGTGIAPFHSMIKSYSKLSYTVLHGVQYLDEAYGLESFDKKRYIVCTSKEDTGNFYGRITEFLKQSDFPKDTIFFICGNSNMLYETIGILKDKGVEPGNIRKEDYF